MLRFCFMQVVVSGLQIVYPHDKPVVRPGQIATQCVAILRIGQVKLPEIAQIRIRKPFSEFLAQCAREPLEYLFAVGGFLFATAI